MVFNAYAHRLCAVFMMSLWLGLLAPQKSGAMAEQQVRNVVVLTCPQDIDTPQVLCRELIQALARSKTRLDVRLQEVGETFVPGPGQVGATVLIDDVADTHVRGHFEWQSGDKPGVNRGPSVELSVMDVRMTPVFYAQFAEALVSGTPELLGR